MKKGLLFIIFGLIFSINVYAKDSVIEGACGTGEIKVFLDYDTPADGSDSIATGKEICITPGENFDKEDYDEFFIDDVITDITRSKDGDAATWNRSTFK